MLEQKPFAAFIDLIDFDKKIHILQKDILAMRQRLEAVRDRHDELMKKTIENQNLINTLRVQITLQEKEIQNFDIQEKAKKKIVSESSDYREIKALQAEIDDLKRSQIEYEQLIMQSWNKLEQAQKEGLKIQGAHTQGAKDLDEEIALIEADILKESHILNEHLENRPTKVALVPQEWLDHYIIMSSRVMDPVVPVEQDSCSACFTSIAKQDMLRLLKKALLKCKMCFRLLYMPSAMERDRAE